MLNEENFHIVYSTGEHEPARFFFEALLHSKRFDLGLGYFSSTAINVLSAGFAWFIYRGGEIRIIMNDVLSTQDQQAIEEGMKKMDIEIEEKIIENIRILAKNLSKQNKHFFNCLSYLVCQKRIQFLATRPLNNKGGIAHSKYGIFTDEAGNKVAFNGSANFSASALTKNVECISCYKSWSKSGDELERLDYFENLFHETWSGHSKNLQVVPIEKVNTYLREYFPVKSIQELLDEEKELIGALPISEDYISKRMEELYSQINHIPRFPFLQGPREYQQEAYMNWKRNDYHGIFAMATGTGKTITSLNCVLNEYRYNGGYHGLVLVPTLDLVDQWKKEITRFNFKNIIEVSGRTNWREELTRLKNDYTWGIASDYFIVSTYNSFTDPLFQKLLAPLQKDLILIADEAHNIGAPKVKAAFRDFNVKKRIALSATPTRAYDPEGTQEIESIFNDTPPYCYNFSMKEAIEKNFLTNYFYYPRIVHLQEEEFKKYIEITRKLQKYFDRETKQLKKCMEVERLLLLRKQIIHKAKNKLQLFKQIVREVQDSRKLKYCFVYVPEGFGDKEGEKFTYIEEMVKTLYVVSPSTTSNIFIGGDNNRRDKLKGFAEGKIDVLFAMKCLDEGVDVPRAEIGIFASSTGNPRQFIQRRGRLLRKAKGKQFAYIYDMVVIPHVKFSSDSEFYDIERSLVYSELTRVAYFASLSRNFYESKIVLEEVSRHYNLDIDMIIKDL